MVEIITDFSIRGRFDHPQKLKKVLPYQGNLFRSYYIYGDEINQYIIDGKPFTEYQGSYDIDNVIIDIDGHGNKTSMTLALEKVNDIVSWLLGKGVDTDNFLVWFSGGGFHIHIAASLFGFKPGPDLPETVRDTCLSLFPQGDNIYYPRSIIRVGYSYNEKRKRWKIPLHLHELANGIDQIIELSQSGELRPGFRFDCDVFEAVLADYVVESKAKFVKRDVELLTGKDYSNVVTCMHKMYDRGPIEGRRHTDMLRLASWMRRSHMPMEVIYDTLQSWAINVPRNEIEKLVNDTFKKDYRYGCNDPVRLEFCDSKCIYFERKNEGTEVMKQSEMDDEMVEYAVSGKYENFIDLEPLTKQQYRIYPGEFVVISGETGVNKSTFVQQIAIENPHHKILYVTTEVDRRLMYRRYLQMVTHMEKQEIMEIFVKGNIVPGSSKLSHIQIVDNMPTWEKLIYTIIEIDPHIVILDVMEDIGKGTSMDNIEFNAGACKSMAMQLNKIIIAVAHMRKAQGRFNARKTLDDAKGPSILKQKADKMILIEGLPNQLKRSISSGKARDEQPFQIDMIFNPDTFKLEHGEFRTTGLDTTGAR